MKLAGTAKLLRIFLGESDRHGGVPLFVAIVEAARRAGLSGATVLKGIEGYGGHSVVHAARVFDLSGDLPIIVEIVDTEQKIRDFIPAIEAMIGDGLVTLENIDVIRYESRRPEDSP